MRPTPLPLATLRAALAASGAAPRKRHGQHFLTDDNLLAAIVRDGAVTAEDLVLEIGPGPGLLTRHLLATGARVLAIEIDPAMREVCGRLVEPDLAERLEWIEGDAMAGGRRLAEATKAALDRASRLVANLPYNVSAPLMAGVLLRDGGPERMAVTVQREMGDRFLAPVGSRDYGPLAIIAALHAEAARGRSIPPSAFWPRPRVQSVVVTFRRRLAPALQAEPLAPGALEAFLGAAFHNRRKTLMNSVSGATGVPAQEVAERLELPENLRNRRPESFDALQFYGLARRWAQPALGERLRPDP